MAIRVSLHPNVLRKDGSKFARVVAPNRMSFEVLLEYMVKDTALEKNDMRSVLQQFRSAVCTFLKLGYRVDTPIGSFRPGVASGTIRVNGHVPPITTSHLRVNFVPHTGLVAEFRRNALLTTEEFGGYAQPLLMHMSNVNNETEDVHFSPGTLCKMVGSRVTFDKSDPAQGLFFVNADATKTPVRIATYSRTGSRYIDFLIPTDMPHGTYQLELRTLTRNGEPRTALYDRILEIG